MAACHHSLEHVCCQVALVNCLPERFIEIAVWFGEARRFGSKELDGVYSSSRN